jgi:hypothetical protein
MDTREARNIAHYSHLADRNRFDELFDAPPYGWARRRIAVAEERCAA